MQQRTRRAIYLTGFGALTAAVLAMPGGATASEQPPASLHVLKPGVEVSVKGGPFRPITADQTIATGTTVRTSTMGRARITYSDGSDVLLSPATTYTIQRLEPESATPVIFGKLDVGRTLHRVAKASGVKNHYRVDTGNAVASVRGTTFSVACTAARECSVHVVEGEVGVRGVRDAVTQALTAGQRAVITRTGVASVSRGQRPASTVSTLAEGRRPRPAGPAADPTPQGLTATDKPAPPLAGETARSAPPAPSDPPPAAPPPADHQPARDARRPPNRARGDQAAGKARAARPSGSNDATKDSRPKDDGPQVEAPKDPAPMDESMFEKPKDEQGGDHKQRWQPNGDQHQGWKPVTFDADGKPQNDKDKDKDKDKGNDPNGQAGGHDEGNGKGEQGSGGESNNGQGSESKPAEGGSSEGGQTGGSQAGGSGSQGGNGSGGGYGHK